MVALLREHGLTGWRRHFSVFGKPDFVFLKERLALFVDGCFWHGCPIHGTKPKQHAKSWRDKIARDRLVTRTLRARGWRILRVGEHELPHKNKKRLLARLRRALGNNRVRA
jgi:DNA mismatch endonuclease (patch repair protein)